MQSPSPSFRVTTHDGQIAAAAAGNGKVANLSDLVERFKGDIDTTPAGQISGDMVAASFDIHMTQYELRQAQEMEPQNVTLNVINRPAFDNCSFFFDPTSVAGGTARACCVVSADQVEQIKKNGWLPLSIAFYDHSTPKCTLPIIEASSSSPTDAMNPVAVVNGGGTIVAASAGAAPGEVHGPNLPSAGGASETSQSAGKLDEEIRQCDCTGVHRSKCPAQLPMELPKIDTKSMASAAEQIVQWFEVRDDLLRVASSCVDHPFCRAGWCQQGEGTDVPLDNEGKETPHCKSQ